MSLKEINMKVVSYCDIPEELTEDSFLQDLGCDVYAEYSLSDDPKYTQDELDIWLSNEYPELMNTKFLIHIDY